MKVRTDAISSVSGKACAFANFIRSDFFKIRFASARAESSTFSWFLKYSVISSVVQSGAGKRYLLPR